MARDQQVSDEEIGTIQGIVMAVAAGKINSMMRELDSPSKS